MKLRIIQFVLFLGFIGAGISCLTAQNEGKHLFILSGQSNMARLQLKESFTPTIETAFGKENVIITKYAKGGEPIRRWYKNWRPEDGHETEADPALYDSLITKVNLAIENKSLNSITFIWMQGERDAREGHGAVYENSLIGLHQQLCTDLNRKDINFVIGRLSDFGTTNKKFTHWNMIREIQVKVANSNARFEWIDTDNFNDGVNRKGKAINNDLHMSSDGYVELGKKFADVAIQLIQKSGH